MQVARRHPKGGVKMERYVATRTRLENAEYPSLSIQWRERVPGSAWEGNALLNLLK